MSNLIISLTTIHSRIDKIHHVIESLLVQESPIPFKVCLFLSHEPYLLDEGVAAIPEELQQLCNENKEQLEIIYTKNIGPYRKFLPILKRYFADEIELTYLVTVDDDTVYPQHWLSTLVEACEQQKCVVAYRGRKISCDENAIHRYKKWTHSDDSVLIPDLKIVGTGKDGIIYKPEYFHPDVIDIENALKVCNHADDLWLKMHTTVNGVPSVLLSESLSSAFQDLGEEDENTLYRKINKFGGNDRAMENLTKYFLARYDLNILDIFNQNLSSSSTWLGKKFINSYF
ncbi:glycosyltransferase [Paraglaciecola marina]|uniref:glycosyltransferase n=1 Tax=Paraglaciecola marina TaxID=2500157 RepID=UPI001414E070|nr:glycosyltransferase [Paraglaciecola marina]